MQQLPGLVALGRKCACECWFRVLQWNGFALPHLTFIPWHKQAFLKDRLTSVLDGGTGAEIPTVGLLGDKDHSIHSPQRIPLPSMTYSH